MGAAKAATAAVILVLAGCGSQRPAAHVRSGVSGRVDLGPQCPVEVVGQRCDDKPAANIAVTVHQPSRSDRATVGDVVAHGTTSSDGTFRIGVAPGVYLVTAAAGMSCEETAVRVTSAAYVTVAIRCDTGIR